MAVKTIRPEGASRSPDVGDEASGREAGLRGQVSFVLCAPSSSR